jgi:hypothetical protein
MAVEVVIPPGPQACCGAMTHHQGELEQTKALAHQLVASFAAVVGPGEAGWIRAPGCFWMYLVHFWDITRSVTYCSLKCIKIHKMAREGSFRTRETLLVKSIYP